MLGVLKKALRKKIIFNTFIMIVHSKNLLILTHRFLPATTATIATALGWRVLSE